MKFRFYLFVLMATIAFVCCKNENNIEENCVSIYGNWKLMSDIQCDNIKNIEYQPENDHYPIVLSFVSSNQVCGCHDANSYEGAYCINNNQLHFENISVTDVVDNEWYTNYISALQCIYKFDISNHDTLKLVTENDSHTFVFLRKNKFNINVDSIYFYFSIGKTDSLNVENCLQGSSWVLIYDETSTPNTKHYIDAVTFCIQTNDSIYGRVGEENYNGKCVADGDNICVSIDYNNNNKSQCFDNYIKTLTSVTSFSVNNDSLKLKNDNEPSMLIFIKMPK